MRCLGWFNRLQCIALASVACGCVSGGFSPDAQTTRVYKHAGSIQCRPDSGLSLADMERPLNDAGLRVFDAYCAGAADAVLPAMCGLDKGVMGAFELPVSDAKKADSLGYERLTFKVNQAACRL